MSKPPLPPSVQQTIDDPQSQELTSGEGGANTPSNNELAIYQTAGTQEGQKEDPEFDDDQDPTNDQNPVTKLKKRKTGALNADGVIEAIVVKKKKKKLKVLEQQPIRIVFNVFNTQYDIIKDTGKRDFNWKLSLKDPWST